MVGIRIAVVLLLAGCAMGDGLGSLLDQASSLQNQAMGMANNVLKHSLSDVMKLARNPDYLREVQQLTQQYASDPEELARRTQALNEKYLNGNGGVNALASFAVMAAAFVVSKLFTV
ncbi:hypothetical protein V1264_009984 [Littorina saxatilis]|uniref:Uncharacterized protein n=1 Tax=Littorina saxatilis TaxID=31220 RepID=A0AAN9ANN9_9CAEN